MASPKYRDYFITVNKGAESFENAFDIVGDLNYVLYAYIVHDKDKEIQEDGSLTPKKLHKHIVVELKNPITFKSMQDKFKGAHIENIKYKKAAYQYLIHNRPNAREKYQYDLKEIVSNNLPAVKEAINQEEGLRLFAENQFLLYIAEGITTPYRFVKCFGLNSYKQYWRPYSEMLSLSQSDEDMIRDLEQVKKQLEDELPF